MSEKKKRMTPAQWAEARAMWASGEFNLDQISEKYGVSRETLSRRFNKDGVKKGDAAIDKKIEAEIIEKTITNAEKWAERGEQARESYFKAMDMLHKMTVKTIVDAQRGSGLFTAQPDLKALQMGATTLGIIRQNQWAVIGLDKDLGDDDAIPELLVRSLTPEEVQKIRTMQSQLPEDDIIEIGDAAPYLEDDLDDLDDDLVVEGEDD